MSGSGYSSVITMTDLITLLLPLVAVEGNLDPIPRLEFHCSP